MSVLKKILRILEIICAVLLCFILSGMLALMGLAMFSIFFIHPSGMLLTFPLIIKIIIFLFYIVMWIIGYILIYKEEKGKCKL
jgi:hypothetical protein